ncbi:hypothetical protein FDECE_3206 [Fusarium decemcellulare]|nr:hypothetical protein FDECE_3206 [Fusarium decemcellulare]
MNDSTRWSWFFPPRLPFTFPRSFSLLCILGGFAGTAGPQGAQKVPERLPGLPETSCKVWRGAPKLLDMLAPQCPLRILRQSYESPQPACSSASPVGFPLAAEPCSVLFFSIGTCADPLAALQSRRRHRRDIYDDRPTSAPSLDVPQIGSNHPFVLHALLSIAALHIAHQDPSERKTRWVDAVRHHNKALDGFQKAIRCVTEDNSEALFMWSIFNVLYVFAMSNPLQETEDAASRPTSSSRNDKILGAEWAPMIRGLGAVLGPTHNYLRLGRMSTIMSLGNWDELDPDRDSSGPEDGYFCGSRQTWTDSNCPEIYEGALQILRKCYLYSQQFRYMDPQIVDQWGFNRAWSGPLIFIHFAPEPYFSLLRQRQPPALVLFAFFGALLHQLNDYWFLEGWGKAIVEVVEDILGSYWKPWISWPLEVVRG